MFRLRFHVLVHDRRCPQESVLRIWKPQLKPFEHSVQDQALQPGKHSPSLAFYLFFDSEKHSFDIKQKAAHAQSAHRFYRSSGLQFPTNSY